MTDLAGEVTFVNEVAATLIGVTPEAVLGQPLTEVLVIIDAATRRRVAVLGNSLAALTCE